MTIIWELVSNGEIEKLDLFPDQQNENLNLTTCQGNS
jgi:hypothetical protein